MKKIIFFLIIFKILQFSAFAFSVDEQFGEFFNSDEVARIENEFQNYSFDFEENFGKVNLLGGIKNGWSLNPVNIIKNGLNFLIGSIKNNTWILVQILAIVIICGVVGGLQKGFGNFKNADVAFFACYGVIAILGIKIFMNATEIAATFINALAGFVNSIIPAIMIFMVASGGITSAAVFQPTLIASTQITTFIIKEVFLPLIFVSFSLAIIGNISDKIKLSPIVSIINTFIKWALGALLTIFVAIISLQKIFAPSIDGKAVIISKYAAKTFVPVVGNILSDTVETVGGCAALMKNAIGVGGLIGICVICVIPILQIVAQIAITKLSAASSSLVADKKITNCINEISNSLSMIFICMLSLVLMMFINISMVIHAGGLYGVR